VSDAEAVFPEPAVAMTAGNQPGTTTKELVVDIERK
jgi:hypothetical protein